MKNPVRVYLATLGCAKNLVDSERLMGALVSSGALIAASPEDADCLIVNTCGFISPAIDESIRTILKLARHKRDGEVARKLIVTGCLAARYAQALRKQLPEVDAVFGLESFDRILHACGLKSKKESPGRLLLTPSHTAYLRISDGCDNRCAYCTIPSIRGPYRSSPFPELIAEARRLVDIGVRELVLIGQDTTLYGVDRARSPRIHQLIEELAQIPKLHWLRLLYTHPAHFSQQLIDAYAGIPKLCKYVDLPLQHLNDEILSRMGRKVTQEQCLDLVSRLRETVPGIAIRTAFITGFPGETRNQFEELLQLVREVRFDHLGAFKYSREPGTRAAKMRGQISEAAKSRRLGQIMRAQSEIVAEKNRTMKGKVLELLIEKAAPGKEGAWLARSQYQAPDVDSVTYISGRSLSSGRFIKAVITGSQDYDLLAKERGPE